MQLNSIANSEPGQVYWRAVRRLFASLRTGRRTLCSVALFAVAFHACSAKARAQSAVDEYHVKAAFLFHFAQLVEWPSDSPNLGGNSLLLCTLGDDPFHGELDNTVAGKQIGSRILRVRHLGRFPDARGCNLLFISKGESDRIPSLLESLRNAPVLTVGDADGFLAAGGMIRLFLDENKVRFEINRQAAEAARLRISSQLLFLAKNVVDGNGKK
jgi:hypothetical protein